MSWRALHCNASLASVAHSLSSLQIAANDLLQLEQSTLKLNLLNDKAICFCDGRSARRSW